MVSHTLTLALATMALSGPSLTGPSTAGPSSIQGSAANSARFGPTSEITGSRLRAHLEFIAHDLLEGRDTPSRGLDIAAIYIAAQMKLFGLKPGGDNGTFFQNITMIRTGGGTASAKYSGADLRLGEDISVSDFKANFTAGFAFVGYGSVAPSRNLDPYAGIDLKGKVAVVMQGLGPGIRFQDVSSGAIPDYENAFSAAEKRGAVAILYVTGANTSANSMATRMRWMTSGQGRWAMKGAEGGRNANLPVLAVSAQLAERMFEGETVSFANIRAAAESGTPPRSFVLGSEKSLTLNVDPKIEETVTKNVIAIAEGSDPVLKNEYVAFGAHYDHVGMRTTGEDRIFNGADDDGSGTVALIEMAHAAMKDRNHKRSFLFVWHTGEEKGLWGSEYFVNNPTVPLNNIITQLNADMIGRSATPGRSYREPMTDSNSIHILGHGRLSSDLERIVYDVNRNFLNLRYETHYDRPNDPQNLYQRSDHYNYAVKGIPICFWFDGIHEDYHQVSDEVDKIDFPKLEKVSRTIFATAWTLANAPNRPRVDRDGRPR